MSGVYSLSTTVDITFILPKLDLKTDKKAIKLFKLHFWLCVKNGATFHHFFFFFTYHPKSTLQKRSIVYYYFSPLIIDLLYPKVLYKSVVLSSKNAAFPNRTSLIIPESLF